MITTTPYGLIYRLTNRHNGKVYIGQTVRTLDQRWWQHCSDARCGLDLRISRAIRKWGPQAFTIEIIAECSDQECLDAFEEHFIAEHNSCAPTIGYNDDPHPRGTGKRSEATKQRISQALKGKIFSASHRAKISEGKKGMPPHNKGMKASQETRARISASRKAVIESSGEAK